jgi:O-acetyl-ADP-ribose deacetylase (regulator of RNase III)/uncharacterized protein YwgA
MITFTTGNILQAEAEALVNTVNTVGVMGKGIALAFKKSFPRNFKAYEEAVKKEELQIGKVLLTETGEITPKYIINFPTKKHWRHPSKIEYVEAGLKDLVRVIETHHIQSIAIPSLGCGNGKLDWQEVKPLLLSYLQPLAGKVDVQVYEPGYNDQRVVEKEAVKLTPARAMLLHLLDQYQVLGYAVNLLVAQKLAYFLQKFGEPLNLEFEKGHFGPYAHRLQHLLKYLNGSFIYFKEEENKPGTPIHLNQALLPEVQDYLSQQLSPEQKRRVEQVLQLIEGFESPFGLELLATVDYVVQHTQIEHPEKLQEEVHKWTSRKKSLMKPYHIQVARERLGDFG